MFLLEIAKFLEKNTLGTCGEDLFLGEMPEDPPTCIALFEYAGDAPDLHWNGEYPGLQVRSRGKTYTEAREKAMGVYQVLHGLYEQTLSVDDDEEEGEGEGGGEGEGEGEGVKGTRYLLIKAFGSPELLKKYTNGWVEFVQHFEVIKER